MTNLVEHWYPRVCGWGFRPVHCIAVSVAFAILAVVAFSLCVTSDVWTASRASHLALAHLGLVHDSTLYHPVWGWALRRLGLSSVHLSTVCTGLSAGLLVFCLSRAKNIVAGVVAASLFAASPWVISSGAGFAFAPFDIVLAMSVIALVPLIGEPGGLWRWPSAIGVFCLLVLDLLRATIGNFTEPLLDGLVVSAIIAAFLGWGLASALEAAEAWVHACWLMLIAILLTLAYYFAPTFGVWQENHIENDIAKIVLGKCSSRTKWLVTDQSLEDALAYRLARDGSQIRLVSIAYDRDAQYRSRLAKIAEREYPDAPSLRVAARLGVIPFLEELPFVETNQAAIVFSWGPRIWGKREVEILKAVRRASANTNHVRRINAMIDNIGKAAQAGNRTKIEAWATQLVREDRANPLGNAVLGTSTAIGGDDEAAVLHFANAVRKGNVPALIWNDYAESLRRVGRFDEAEMAISRAIEKSPDEWRLYETLADIRWTAKRPLNETKEALQKGEVLSARLPICQKPTLVFLRAAVLREEGKRQESMKLLRRIRPEVASPYLNARIKSIIGQ